MKIENGVKNIQTAGYNGARTVLGGHAWRNIFMACSKLEAMAIYVVKQACGHDI